MRTGGGTRSHWSNGFYDVCAGTVEDLERVEPVEQMELF
jgi:hypothetical protein